MKHPQNKFDLQYYPLNFKHEKMRHENHRLKVKVKAKNKLKHLTYGLQRLKYCANCNFLRRRPLRRPPVLDRLVSGLAAAVGEGLHFLIGVLLTLSSMYALYFSDSRYLLRRRPPRRAPVLDRLGPGLAFPGEGLDLFVGRLAYSENYIHPYTLYTQVPSQETSPWTSRGP